MKQQKPSFYLKQHNFYLETCWKDNNGSDLYQPNGFDNLPEKIYRVFCKQIDKDGKVLDLGCGNGLMLKYLMKSPSHKLIPYGVDFLEPSIKQAKEIVHPQHAANFIVGNIVDYSFKGGPFDFIFTALQHVYSTDREEYLKKIKGHCRKGGKVIFYAYPDVLKRVGWDDRFPELKTWQLVRKDYPEVSIGIWKKS